MTASGRGRAVLLVLLAAFPGCEPGRLEHAADGHRTGHGRRMGDRGEGRWHRASLEAFEMGDALRINRERCPSGNCA